MTTILKVKKQINPKLDVAGILLTIVDGRRNLSKEISEELKDGNQYSIEFNLKNILILYLSSNILKQEMHSY